MITQSERRNFIRMAVKAEVSIQRKDGSQLVGQSHNLSATGLSVALDAPLEMSEEVDIFIASSSEGVRPLEASANVVRVEEQEDQSYEVGLVIGDYK